MQPQTDREILLLINERQENSEKATAEALDRLSKSIEKVIAAMEKMERERLNILEDRLSKVEKWQSKAEGAGWLIKILYPVVGGVVGFFASKYFK